MNRRDFELRRADLHAELLSELKDIRAEHASGNISAHMALDLIGDAKNRYSVCVLDLSATELDYGDGMDVFSN